jgi:hypothetical protein
MKGRVLSSSRHEIQWGAPRFNLGLWMAVATGVGFVWAVFG